MTQEITSEIDAEIALAEMLLTVLRGARLSPDTAMAQAAVRRERAMEAELRALRARPRQMDLPNVAEFPQEGPSAAGAR